MIKLEDCPEDIQEKLTSEDINIRREFATNLNYKKYLHLLINDKNDYVRLYASLLVDIFTLSQMANDTFHGVRWHVANRIFDVNILLIMTNDDVEYVKNKAVERLKELKLKFEWSEETWKELTNITSDRYNFIFKKENIKYLPLLINDEDKYIRYYVAKNINISYLPDMMNDVCSEVRYSVAERISSSYLPLMMNDEDNGIRYKVARRIHPSYLPQMIDDKFYNIRMLIKERLGMFPIELSIVVNGADPKDKIHQIVAETSNMTTNKKCLICNKNKDKYAKTDTITNNR